MLIKTTKLSNFNKRRLKKQQNFNIHSLLEGIRNLVNSKLLGKKKTGETDERYNELMRALEQVTLDIKEMAKPNDRKIKS